MIKGRLLGRVSAVVENVGIFQEEMSQE